jgi:hypothetical protein
MGAAMASSAHDLAQRLPGRVAERARWTAGIDTLPAAEFGLAVRHAGDELVLAFIAGSPRAARTVADMVRAFIGPSHGVNRRPLAMLPRGDVFADEVWALAGDNAVQVVVAPALTTERCLLAVDRLLDVQERMPPTAAVAVRPLAPILRDYEGAVIRGDIATAETLRDEAWATGRLTLVNRSFLDMRIVAATGDAAAVIAHARRFRMADLDLPGPVEHDVIRALGSVFLASKDGGDRDALVAAFRGDIAPEFGAAFRDHRLAASPEARLAWCAHYLSLDPVPHAALRELVEQAIGEERLALAGLLESAGTTGADLDELKALRATGEHAAAFAVALHEPSLAPAARAEALAATAASLDDPVRQAQADAALAEVRVDDHPSGTLTEADPAFASVSDWRTWLEALFEHPDSEQALKVLDAGSERWSEALRASADDLADWADPIETLAGESALRVAIPRLAQAVLPDGPDAATLAVRRTPTMLALSFAIAEDTAPGTGGLDALGDLVEALLPTGLTPESYALLVDRCERVFLALSAPPRLARWIVDIVRAVMHEPAPSDQARDEAVGRFVGMLLPDAGRVRPLIRAEVWSEWAELLSDLAAYGDVLATFLAAEANATDEAFTEFQGKSVLLHSLVENAVDRAKLFLESNGAGRVWADSSHVGSDRLRDLASRADIVVVAAKAAKHAAYGTIRPAAGDRLRYATGKGWSSLVTAAGDATRAG